MLPGISAAFSKTPCPSSYFQKDDFPYYCCTWTNFFPLSLVEYVSTSLQFRTTSFHLLNLWICYNTQQPHKRLYARHFPFSRWIQLQYRHEIVPSCNRFSLAKTTNNFHCQIRYDRWRFRRCRSHTTIPLLVFAVANAHVQAWTVWGSNPTAGMIFVVVYDILCLDLRTWHCTVAEYPCWPPCRNAAGWTHLWSVLLFPTPYSSRLLLLWCSLCQSGQHADGDYRKWTVVLISKIVITPYEQS